MPERDVRSTDPQREHTDDSLRVERDKSDAGVAAVEEAADREMERARRLADEVAKAARDKADRTGLTEVTAQATSERARADGRLEDERSAADAVLERERAARRRYLAEYLETEREATDHDLLAERAQADTVIAARDEFLAVVAHDLRSFLSGLSLSAGLLAEDAPVGEGGETMRRHAALSLRMVGRMNRLINDLLDVTSIEAGRFSVVLERVKLAEILRDTLEAFSPVAGAKRITLSGEGGELLHDVRLDSGRILQVLANLVSNAIKFTPAGGRVSIRITEENHEIEIAVSDTGIGIPTEALAGVFERFRQVSKDRRGLGLGLHIAKHIVEAHGGRMWATSTLGMGSTFYIALPAKH